MHYLDGKPSIEVVGISVSAVNTNTSRVRAHIRNLCERGIYDVEL